MGNMKNLGETALSKQTQDHEALMFEITHVQHEQDRDQFDSLSEEDKEFLNKYYKINKEIDDYGDTQQRNELRGKSTQLQTDKIADLEKIKNKLENELNLRPHVVNFLAYKKEEQKLRNPHNPTSN